MAPAGENHLLRSATEIREITYGPRGIVYTSLPDSIELLKVARAPRTVTIGGAPVEPSAGLRAADGWWFNTESGVLLVRHGKPRVEVAF